MNPALPRVWRWLSLCGALSGALSAMAAPEPHPTRAGRLVETRDSITVEYSPGQEPWVEEVFTQGRALNQARAHRPSLAESSPAPPLSPADLRARQAEVLARIATLTGLDAPSELQAQVFTTFLAYYDATGRLMQQLAEVARDAGRIETAMIWDKAEVVRRLAAGEELPGFTYDAATGMVSYDIKFETSGQDEEVKQLGDDMDRKRLDHDFNFTVKDGIADFSATIRLGTKAKPPPATATPADPAPPAPASPTPLAAVRVPLLIGLSAKNSGQPPATVVAESLATLSSFEAQAHQTAAYRAGHFVFVILHEVAETGLVEHHIGSADRRWLCDGTANYVAWRVAREFADDTFAREVYDLDAQLRQHAAQQPHIRLAAWPAVENTKEPDRNSPLTRAHYAFATRAMFLLAAQHGPDALQKIWRTVGQTPRRKASAKTFAAAYRKLTGEKLERLIAAAERTPLPPAPEPTRASGAPAQPSAPLSPTPPADASTPAAASAPVAPAGTAP